MQVHPLGWEDPLEEDMATTPAFLPGESHGQRSLAGCSPQGYKESDTTERLHFPLQACGVQPNTPCPQKAKILAEGTSTPVTWTQHWSQ